MTQKIITLLGRVGDILAFLPVLHAEFKNGQRCGLLVAEEFSGVMDGIGYADKIVFKGDCWDLTKAMAQAWTLSSDVKCVQVAGPPELVKQFSYQPNGQEMALTDSFVKESWKLSGHFALWKTQPPLIFDRRDKARETKLLEAFPKKKKVILVAADGKTSPFPHRDLLFKLLKLNFEPKYVVVDLAKFKAERIYDLLALYERVHCLVACDSAPLHLAQACPDLPVVALSNDTPSLWHGTPWRANHVCYIRYKDFGNRAVEMLDAIEEIGGFGTMKGSAAVKGRKVVHVWSQYDVTPDNLERHKAACWEWQNVYGEAQNWIACRIDLRAIGKDSRTILKDEKPFPGLKEVVRLGCFRAKDDDVIVLTRADTQFGGPLTKFQYVPSFARRTLRENLLKSECQTSADSFQDTWHPVCDLFIFTRAWWFEHEKELPDLVMGQDHHWPRVLMELIKKHGGTELALGTIHRTRSKGTIADMGRAYAVHNEGKAKDWLIANGGEAMFPVVSKQVKAMRVNPAALHPYGYNGSIIRHGGKVLMAYRYHPNNNLSTRLGMAEFDEKWNVVKNTTIEVPSQSQSVEDPRLFTYQGQLWMSWVDADFPSPAPTCVVKIGRLTQVGSTWNIEDVLQPQCEKNNGTAVEKNWIFWEHDKSLVFLYGIKDGCQWIASIPSYASPRARWPFGEIRGGTTPLPYKGKLLRFFHSSLDFEMPPSQRRYFMGAAIMEPEPPFATIAVSKEPIVYGSELDDLSETERIGCLPHKKKVVFPAGAIIHEDGWVVSAGVNDCEIVLMNLKEKDLKL